jgi:hypothetical protein
MDGTIKFSSFKFAMFHSKELSPPVRLRPNGDAMKTALTALGKAGLVLVASSVLAGWLLFLLTTSVTLLS